jgi:hypothetical protein
LKSASLVSSSGSRLKLFFACRTGLQTLETDPFISNMLGPSFGSRHPFAHDPRGVVADMLLVSALQLCNPVKTFILMKSHNFPRRSRRLPVHRSPCLMIRPPIQTKEEKARSLPAPRQAEAPRQRSSLQRFASEGGRYELIGRHCRCEDGPKRENVLEDEGPLSCAGARTAGVNALAASICLSVMMPASFL